MKSHLVLFDGVCNFCNYWIRFALTHDKQQQLYFGTLQGETAREILPTLGIDPTKLNSVVFIENGNVWQLSDAVLRICRYFNAPWKWLYLLIVIPAPLRNAVYGFIAKNRYRWFGKKEQCMVPDAQQLARFVA